MNPASHEPSGAGTARRPRVLVVDDEDSTRRALDEILRDEGYDVEVASDGMEALARLIDFAPDVLLTDLRMPRMGGAELAARARALAHPPAVVITSAMVPADDAAVWYVGKPIDIDWLLVVLRQALAASR